MGNEQSSFGLTEEEKKFYRKTGYDQIGAKFKAIDAAREARRQREHEAITDAHPMEPAFLGRQPQQLNPDLIASLESLERRVLNASGSQHGTLMWKVFPVDRDTPLAFQCGDLLKILERPPLFLTAHQIEMWVGSAEVLPHLNELALQIQGKQLYDELHDTAALSEHAMSDTLDLLRSLIPNVGNKSFEDCEDAYEVVSKCALKIAKASDIADFLFDATQYLPKGWSRAECCQEAATRLVITTIANLRDLPHGFLASKVSVTLAKPRSRQIARLDNTEPWLQPNGVYTTETIRYRWPKGRMGNPEAVRRDITATTTKDRTKASSELERQGSGSNQSEAQYCYCGGGEYGEMVGCDNDDCEREWFHFDCLGITRKPQAETWYCTECRASLVEEEAGQTSNMATSDGALEHEEETSASVRETMSKRGRRKRRRWTLGDDSEED